MPVCQQLQPLRLTTLAVNIHWIIYHTILYGLVKIKKDPPQIAKVLICLQILGYWDIVSMLYPWARHLTLKYFTWLGLKWVPGRTDMAMCMITSMRRTGCRTVYSPWSWDGTRMSRSSDQGVNMWKSDEILVIRQKNLHLYLLPIGPVLSIEIHIKIPLKSNKWKIT